MLTTLPAVCRCVSCPQSSTCGFDCRQFLEYTQNLWSDAKLSRLISIQSGKYSHTTQEGTVAWWSVPSTVELKEADSGSKKATGEGYTRQVIGLIPLQ